MFRGFAPVNQKWNYGVARRFETVPWTVFYMIPEDAVIAQTATVTRDKAAFAGAIILVALVAGALFAAVILSPIRSLSRATKALAAGDGGARVPVGRGDELGRLGTTFNSMAERIQSQAAALNAANEELEQRVRQRTVALRESEQSLALTLDSIGDAVIANEINGRVARMNPVAERLTGWTAAEAHGRPLVEVFRILEEDTRRPAEDPATRVLRDGLVVGLANHTLLLSRDGAERPIADSGAPIRDAQGAVRGVVLVFLRDYVAYYHDDRTHASRPRKGNADGANCGTDSLRRS